MATRIEGGNMTGEQTNENRDDSAVASQVVDVEPNSGCGPMVGYGRDAGPLTPEATNPLPWLIRRLQKSSEDSGSR